MDCICTPMQGIFLRHQVLPYTILGVGEIYLCYNKS